MTPDRWQRVNQLFHSALELDSEKRATFLLEVCAGDESLRRHVESLISAHEKAGSFIERPAFEVEARELAGETVPTYIASGKTISHYEIISPLGSGGMGDVYLAQDLILNRQVALKLLPEYFTRDRDRLRRFQQEARTASSLNHPNIITTYEIGQVDDRHFIALEFIDGETLRQNLIAKSRDSAGTPLRMREALDIAIQTGDALAAAHEAHIIHRDIKPENIMVRRRDGYVKVLDFGLAKLTEGPVVEVEATTRALVQTSAGMVMGTVNYMSPEQARGEKVDVRTDIWSLGVVLYEMLAGCVPFDRSTPTEVIALILEREPPPLTRFARDVPAELDRIVSKALTKDAELRYQIAKDLLIDLRRLKQRLEIEIEIQRIGEPPEKLGEKASAGAQQAVVTEKTVSEEKRDTSTVHPNSRAEYWVTGNKRQKYAGIVLGFLAVTVIGYGIHKLTRRSETTVSFQSATLSRLTTTGKATMVAISPDAKWVVHVMNDGGKRSLWTRQVATQSNIEIVPPAVVTYRGLTFSPDGNYIYYSVSSKDAPQIALFQVSTLGGIPTKVLDDLDGDIDHVVSATVSFSPNGKQIAFLRKGASKETALMIANADGSGERNVTTYQPEDGIGFPKWSPDGRTIAYAVLNYPSNKMTIVEAQVADGSRKPLTSQKWLRIFGLAWLADGGGLLMIAGRDTFVCQIWHLSHPAGEAHQLTNDLNDYVGMSLATDADTLAVVKMEKQANISIAPNNNTSRARPVTSGPGKADDQVALSPDGNKIVFRSNASGNSDIWIVNADGSNPKQLTANAGSNVGPVVSPDGRHILFLSDRSGIPHIWQMNIEGSDQKQLTHGNGEQLPQFSPDGRWIVYSTISESSNVWRIGAAGGESVQLTDKTSMFPTVSPDGKLVACLYKDGNAPVRIAIIPLEGGRPLKTLDYGMPPAILRWTPDGRAIAYVDPRDSVSNILARPLDGGAIKQLTNFKADRTFSFDWSRDGSQFALSRGTQGSDVILIKYIH